VEFEPTSQSHPPVARGPRLTDDRKLHALARFKPSRTVAIRRNLSGSPQDSPQTHFSHLRDDGKPMYCLIF